MQDTAARYAPYVLSIVRIVAALLFFEHGTSRLFGWPSPLPTPALLSMYWFAGAIELVGGALLALGLFTRPVALIMSGEMAFAYFISHAPAGFFPILNRGDAAILYCFIFLYIAFAGGGPWSVDALMGRKASAVVTGTAAQALAGRLLVRAARGWAGTARAVGPVLSSRGQINPDEHPGDSEDHHQHRDQAVVFVHRPPRPAGSGMSAAPSSTEAGPSLPSSGRRWQEGADGD